MNRILKKHKEWAIGPRNSLRNKIIKDSFRYFIVFFFIFNSVIFLYYFFFKYNSLIISLDRIINTLFTSFITFIMIMLSFKITLEKHLLNRFKNIRNDMEEVKNGNFSRRIKIESLDELGEFAYFTNSVLEEFEKKLEFEKKYSLMDPLTLCYNRRALKISFAKFSSRIKRGEKIGLSCALFDIDNFKILNDTYGHNVGDEVLKELAKTVRKILRKDDSLYRVGGEEFLILFFKLPKSKEKELIKRLQREITYQLKKKLEKITQKITVSGGFVNTNKYDLTKEESLEKIIEEADKLLYKAKKNGKDQILFN